MAIRVACLSCGHRFTVEDKAAGPKKRACPRCGSTWQIQLLEPTARTAPSESSDQPAEGLQAPAAPGPTEPAETVGGVGRERPPEPTSGGAEREPSSAPESPGPEPAGATPTGQAEGSATTGELAAGPQADRPSGSGRAWALGAGAAGLVSLICVVWILSAIWGSGNHKDVRLRDWATGGGSAGGKPVAQEVQPEAGGRAGAASERDRVREASAEPAGRPTEAPGQTRGGRGPAETVVAADQGPGTEPAPAAETEPSSTQQPPPDTRRPAKVARSLEEAKEALVKLIMPLGIGQLAQHGTGFLIDARGWVATNDHLLRSMTRAAHAELADGSRLELAGIVARAPRQDLAILQLQRPLPELTVLDITHPIEPRLGQQVFAFGHPYDVGFSLTKGIVSNVQTTTQLVRSSPGHLVARLGAPPEMVWIQHDARIGPGNSGGPLIDDQARVFGVNTFYHRRAGFGYASHVKHVRQLAHLPSGRLEPLPEPHRFVRTVVSTRRMAELFDRATAFGWRPETDEQYAQLAELARQMTLARHAQAVGRRAPGLDPELIRRVARAADRTYAVIRSVPWDRQRCEAISRFAADQVDEVGQGVFLVSRVIGRVPDRSALVMDVEGSDKSVVVSLGANAPRLPSGSRWLVVGLITPQVVRVENQAHSVTRVARVVLTYYMRLVEPPATLSVPP